MLGQWKCRFSGVLMLAQLKWRLTGALALSILLLNSISHASPQGKAKKRSPNSAQQETTSSNAYLHSSDEKFTAIFAKITEEIEKESRESDSNKVAHRRVIQSYKNRLEQLRTAWSKEDQESQKCESVQLIFKKGSRIQRNPDKFRQEILISHECDVRADSSGLPSFSNSITQTLELTLAFTQNVNCQNFISCTQRPQSLEILSLSESSKIPGTPVPTGGMSTSGGD